MIRYFVDSKGFTLIETIAALILVGLLAVFVGMGLVRISQSYLFVKECSETVQKAQVAMTRIVKELGAATDISSSPLPTSTSITYTRPTSVTNTISIANSKIQISGTHNGDLIDDVVTANSSFNYYDAAGVEIFPTAATSSNIRRIDVTLRITGANNQTSDFTNSVWIKEFY